MEKSRITDIELRIERSIFGRSVEITEANSRPKTQCFYCGGIRVQ